MPAPTLANPKAQQAAPNGAPARNAAPPAIIPFTRGARKKRRLIGTITQTLTAATQQLAPIQIPANGFIKKLILDVTCTTAANAAATTFAADGPFNVLTQVSVAAANGDSLINPIGGFTLAMLQKYGCFNSSKARDPLCDPTFSVTTGAGATGGSFHFQVDVPFELDARDALCALPNMAANQSFLLQMFLNANATIYGVAPTTPGTVTIVVTAEYWGAPAAQNASGIQQATSPRVTNAVSLIQTQTPAVVAGTDQTIPLLTVGNTLRFLYFEARTAGGVRTDVDWPVNFNLLVNNDLWDVKTKNNWKRQMAQEYGLFGGLATTPTINQLDTGVYIYTDFMNDGGQGDGVPSAAANRDLMLVTGSGTALSIEAQNWGASIGQLLVVANALRIPDPSSFYAPIGI